jgi:hypothetical protein
MRRIINQKVYDTETADLVCDVSGNGANFSQSDFDFDDTSLYRTKKGEWFVAGEGGASSRWGKPYGRNSYTGGAGVRTVTEDEAKALVEEFASDDYENYFEAEEA